jgi:hypothetical protein
MEQNKEDLWDAIWAALCLVLGESTAFLTVYPTLHEVPGFSREGLTVGFGLLLTATYFLMGVPCVGALKRGFYWIKRRLNVGSKTGTEKS